MLERLTCVQGHAWEASAAADTARCPECGLPPDPGMFAEPEDAPVPAPAPPPMSDDKGRPVVVGYEILADRGRSPAGVRLYQARQLVAGREVLLEVVLAREDAGQRAWNALRGEASGHGKLSHPNIVQLYETGERERQLFYSAMEFIDGPTLAEAVGDEPVPAAQAVALVELLARAVAYANEGRQFHRHLEPNAVLLQRVPAPKAGPAMANPGGGVCRLGEGFYIPRLRGFGLARRPVEGDVLDIDLYADAGYLSPEQSWGKGQELGPHTDVYGLGGILYYLLTGRPPFRGPTQDDIIDAIQTAPLVKPSESQRTSAALDFVCRAALARRVSRRYADAGEMADDLRRVAEDRPPELFRPSSAQRLNLWAKRRPGWAALLFMGIVCVASTLIAYAVGGSGEPPTPRRDLSPTDGQAQLENHRLRHRLLEVTDWQRRNDYQGRINFAALVAGTNNSAARDALDECPEAARSFEWHYLDRLLSGKEKTTLPGSEDATAFAFVPSVEDDRLAAFRRPRFNSLIAVASTNRGGTGSTIRILDFTSSAEYFRMPVRDSPVNRIKDLVGNQFLILAGTTPGRLCHLDRQGEGVCEDTVASPTLLGSGSHNAQISVMNELGELRFHNVMGRAEGPTRSLLKNERGNPDPREVRVILSDREIVVSDPTTAKLQSLDTFQPNAILRDLDIPIAGKVECMALTHRGLLALATTENRIYFHEIGLIPQTPPPFLSPKGGVKAMAFSRDGDRLAVAYGDGTLAVLGFLPPRPEELRTNGKVEPGRWAELLTIPVSGVRGLEFGPDGKTLAASGPKGVVVLGAWK